MTTGYPTGERSPTVAGIASQLARLGRFGEAETYLKRLENIADASELAIHTQALVDVYRGTLNSVDTAERYFIEHPTISNTTKGMAWFMLENVERGIAVWDALPDAKRIRLNRYLRTLEYHFPQSVRSDLAYQELLNRLGFGSEWQRYLRCMVAKMSATTLIDVKGVLTTPAENS